MVGRRNLDRHPSVCAIVPTYNRAGFLAECLAALVDQTRAPDDILVIDDGSSDETAAVAAGFAPRGVRYLRQSNQGKAAALNLALSHTEADAVWIFDDDDIASPDALAVLIDGLLAAPEAGFVVGQFDRFTSTPTERTPGYRIPFDADRFPVEQLLRCTVFQPAMLVWRRCYQAVGLFDESFVRAQDYDMLARLSSRFLPAYVPQVVFYQREHLGVRGTAALSISGEEVWERQVAFDGKVLRKVHDTKDLNAFLPHSLRAERLGPEQAVQALLTRAAALAKRKLWDLALADCRRALSTAASIHVDEIPAWIEVMFSHRFWTDAPEVDAMAMIALLRSDRRSVLHDRLLGHLGWAYLARAIDEARRGNLRAFADHAGLYLRAVRARHPLRHVRRLRSRAER